MPHLYVLIKLSRHSEHLLRFLTAELVYFLAGVLNFGNSA